MVEGACDYGCARARPMNRLIAANTQGPESIARRAPAGGRILGSHLGELFRRATLTTVRTRAHNMTRVCEHLERLSWNRAYKGLGRAKVIREERGFYLHEFRQHIIVQRHYPTTTSQSALT